MLKVKKLDPRATVPTVAHPGEDLGYDLYALEDTTLPPCTLTKVRCGVVLEAYINVGNESVGDIFKPAGLLVRDRSSMASKGIFTHGGVIDAGYRGEMLVMLSKSAGVYPGEPAIPYFIKAGDKIAQVLPVPVLTGTVEVVEELSSASRGEKGFGSSGR